MKTQKLNVMETQIIGISGGKFDSSKPAYCTFWTNLDRNGNQVISTLYFTGNSAIREEFGDKFTEFEMIDDGGGTNFISEADLYQR